MTAPAMPERRLAERRVSPAIGEHAILECARLLEVNRELCEQLDILANGMERIAECMPELKAYMPGLEWMPKQARAAIAKAQP